MNVTQPDMQYNFKDSTEYLGNFILTNGKLDKYLFAGGYLTASESGAVFHYYTPDHLGNNRAVIKQDGTIEQVTHYYPFGGIIYDLSTISTVEWNKFVKTVNKINQSK